MYIFHSQTGFPIGSNIAWSFVFAMITQFFSVCSTYVPDWHQIFFEKAFISSFAQNIYETITIKKYRRNVYLLTSGRNKNELSINCA